MSAAKANDRKLDQIPLGRRRLLTRNLLAIGAIAAAGLANPPAALARDHDHDRDRDRDRDPHHHGPKCFLKGTRIRTSTGERNVEDLAIGDLLPTVFGGERPIQWIARYSYRKSDPSKPWAGYARPVRIARSAVAPDVPNADLFVSGGHALFIDGALVIASSLVNGTTITIHAPEESNELEFFHIKLESHDVIYAEGAACETLQNVDEAARNYDEYVRAYGAPRMHEACAPLLFYKGRSGQIKSRFRSAMSLWLDRREKIDLIRDRLEERGAMLSEEAELIA